MRWKIVGYAALFFCITAGISQGASGLLESRPAATLFHREAALKDGGAGATASRTKRGPRGYRGPQGIPGPTGAQGPQGSFSAVVSIRGTTSYLCGYFEGICSIGNSRAQCPTGTKLLGGGYVGAGIRAFIDGPVGNAWSVSAANESEFPTSFEAIAMCAS